MINKERIQLWANALKSGEYEQTTGTLRDKFGYCCLGVACQIAIDNGCTVKVEQEVGEGDNCYHYDESEGNLPLSVIKWYGLEGEDPILKHINGEDISAVDLNDNHCLNFNQIADAIHEKFLV